MKLGELTQLVGEVITSYRDGRFTCASGRRFVLDIQDEGCGGNDSHAYLDDDDMYRVLGFPILAAYPTDASSWGVTLTFESQGGSIPVRGTVTITHEHNGYYGFSWELVEIKP